ncbi:4Fe-4S binding protein [Candidatus Bipolaricaulota bacterium]
MVDLATCFCGLELRNPLIAASGPLTHDGASVIRAYEAGAGAVVTKTIDLEPAINPVPHIASLGQDMLNSEKWSDLKHTEWIEKEIPRAAEAGVTVIASVGHSPEAVAALAGPLESAGAKAIEVVSYDPGALAGMVRAAVNAIRNIPIIAKVSTNRCDCVEVAMACVKEGASGITAIDAVGPSLRFNPEHPTPVVSEGYGWLSGPAILPIALGAVARIAQATNGTVPIAGTGGVSSASDCAEMLMAGASAVGICTLLIKKGVGALAKLSAELPKCLERLGLPSVKSATGAGLHVVDVGKESDIALAWDRDSCTACNVCLMVCPYSARLTIGLADPTTCRRCGLCASACPVGAISLIEAGKGR